MTATKPLRMLDLPGEYQALTDLFLECGEELTPEQDAALSAMAAELEAGAPEVYNNWCAWIASDELAAASETGRIDQLKAYLAECTRRKSSAENRAERKRDCMKKIGMATGLLTCTVQKTETTKKVDGRKITTAPDGWVVGVQNQGGIRALKFIDGEEIPSAYCKEVPDNDKIRAALEAGETLPFAKLEDRGVRLTIK